MIRSAPLSICFHQGEGEAADALRILQEIPEAVLVWSKTFHENPYMKRKHPVAVHLVGRKDFREV